MTWAAFDQMAENKKHKGEYEKQVLAGTAPPLDLVRHCNQEGQVRDAQDRWVPDAKLRLDCFAQNGWVVNSQGSLERK